MSGGRPTSDRILEKSLDLFSSKGYDATSVREICEAAGITKPTLYHFYGSKEGVYRALVEDALEGFQAEIVRTVEGKASARDRLTRVARLYCETGRAQRELMRFIFSLIHNPATSAPRTDFPRFYGDLLARVAAVVDEGVAAGEFRPGSTDIRMLVLMGALGEALHGYVILGHPELTPTLADTIVATVIEGWSAP